MVKRQKDRVMLEKLDDKVESHDDPHGVDSECYNDAGRLKKQDI